MQETLNSRIESLEAELTQCQCRESQLIGERDRANAVVNTQCDKLTELEKRLDQQAHRLDSLNAEVQVGSMAYIQYSSLEVALCHSPEARGP